MSQSKQSPVHTDGDLVSDWVDYDYEEGGHLFVVTQLKSHVATAPLTEEGPYTALARNGRYLIPMSRVEGEVVPFAKPEMYARQRAELRFRDTDVVICGYPRSGCTWMEQLVLLLLARGDPSTLNTEDKNTYRASRPERNGKVYLDVLFGNGEDLAAPWGTMLGQDPPLTVADLESMRHRRVFKTHYKPSLLPGFGKAGDNNKAQGLPPPIETLPGVKYVVVIRDPKDAAVSYRRVNSLPLHKHGIPFNAVARLLATGKVFYPWNDFVAEYLALAQQFPNQFLIVPYEDHRIDPHGWAKRVARFLNIDIGEDELSAAVKHSSFDKMKEMSKGAEAEHVHKGVLGGWKEVMSNDVVRLFNEMVMDERLGEYGGRYYAPENGTSS